MERRTLLKQMGLTISGLTLAGHSQAAPFFEPFATDEKVAKGPFQPTWESLQTYQVPDWYRNAKFGIWAHWGPQCQPEAGDWYARGMYEEGSRQYKIHQEKYGHPSKFGFKDVINEWKADQWNPDELVSLYKGVGAKYFFAMANHHDNLDLYNSKYQKNWNSTKVGPKKDIIGGWAKAAKKQGLPFGVSVHAAHAWRWFETAQRSDKNGPMAGVPYDGNLTKADGKGLWWEGLDPQELYAQRHPLSQNSADNGSIHGQWHWGNGVYPPTKAYMENFVNRTIDLINQYDHSLKKHGELRAILNGKILDENQRKAMVWDIERGQANDVLPFVWQSDTCIGDWHYNRAVYDRKGYKTPQMVVQTLVDVVSKNGNYLLNIPVRGNGSIDEQERAVVEGIGRWMNANSESIYDTRPWTVYGEGPSTENQAKLTGQGFNEGKTKFTAADIRFNTKGDVLYATVMNAPTDGKVTIKSLAQGSANYPKAVNNVTWLSQKQPLPFERTTEGLVVQFPQNRPADTFVDVLKIV